MASFRSIAWQLMSEEQYGDYIREAIDTDCRWIAAEYAVAIVNDDYSGIDERSEMMLNNWLADNPGYITITTCEPEFVRCDICGLMADCHQITIEA